MSKGDDKGASAISVWKRELGPNLSDIFLRKDIDKLRNNNGCPNSEGVDKGQSRCTQRNIIVEGRKKNIYPDFVCRNEFTFDENITCFPNYMHKSSIKIKNKLDICDVIIEVRDARVPFTSTNYFITDNLKKYKNTKKNIILLNKVDLISKELALKAQRLIEEKTNSICLLTSSKYNKNISKIRDICKEIKPKFKAFGLFCMLIGLPNVGKSSIINSFKEITYNLGKYGYKNNKIAYEVNRKKVKTNILAGTTKLIEQYKVSNNPLLYFIDTPGIYLPKMADKEISLKLSAIGNVLDYKYNDMYVGDYILFILNKNKNYNYVKMIGLDKPTNDIRFVSNVISTKLNLCRNYKYLDINGGCKFFIDMFRLGLLGQTCLDEIPNQSDFVTYFDFNSSEPIAVDSNLAPVPFRGLT